MLQLRRFLFSSNCDCGRCPKLHVIAPIPPDLLSQKPTLKDLYEKVVLRVAGNWDKLGLQLDIEHYVLEAIKTPHGSKVDFCLNMLAQWLDGKRDCGKLPKTWSSVLEAVESSCGSEVQREIMIALSS